MTEVADQERTLHSCAYCGSLSTKHCVACHGAPDGQGNNIDKWYCGVKCQKDDWTNHKQSCKTSQSHKKLYHAADTAQALFYTYREMVFDRNINKIEESNGIPVPIYEDVYEEDCLIHFPSSMVSSIALRKALLAYEACDVAYALLDVILPSMLKGKLSSSTMSP